MVLGDLHHVNTHSDSGQFVTQWQALEYVDPAGVFAGITYNLNSLNLQPNTYYTAVVRVIGESPDSTPIESEWSEIGFTVNAVPEITAVSQVSAEPGQPFEVPLDKLEITDADDTTHTLTVHEGEGYTVDGQSVTLTSSAQMVNVGVSVSDGIDDSEVYSIPVVVSTGRRVIFIHTDLLGSPVAESDEDGNIVN